jgi:A/G-specific adenine glycosylase
VTPRRFWPGTIATGGACRGGRNRARPADPYRVWLSEIMLQQTTAVAVAPYFLSFVERWPDVEALAAASLDNVLGAWAGLGYYARARNLHACARTVARDLGGRFPDTESALRRLPGIGPYTAGAIAAIAFGRRAAAVDGNAERVIARLEAIETALPQAKRVIHDRTSSSWFRKTARATSPRR